MAGEFKKQTNSVQKETLTSEIVYAIWGQKIAMAGDKALLEVQTHFVGNGSEIDITVVDKNGKTVTHFTGKIFGDFYSKPVPVPESVRDTLTFTAKLPKHGLEMKSVTLTVVPPFTVTNLKWGQKEARRGDIVQLSADTKGLEDDTDVVIRIFEYDRDGVHDFISKFPCRLKDSKIESYWEYQYHEDTDEIPTEEEMQRYGRHYNHPEYFFTVDVFGKSFGKEQESGLLRFKDWLLINLSDADGDPIVDMEVNCIFPDGSNKKLKSDNDGIVTYKDIPPGKLIIDIDTDQANNLQIIK